MPSVRDLEVNDPSVLLQRITNEFPQVSYKRYEFINHGWDHEVIILDNRLVFRFPASSDYLPRLKEEVKLLDYLHSKVDLPMPRYEYVASNNSFAGYAILPGVELSQKVFCRLETSDQTLVATQLAGFLSQFHLVDVEEAQQFNVVPADLPDEALRIRCDAEKYLRTALREGEYAQVLVVLDELDRTVNGQLPHTLTHNDISPKHLLWDSVGKQLGVIDFSDRSLSDPAMDFAELFIYGVPFVRNVYEAYKGKKDEDFLRRALLYYKRVGICMLIDSFLTDKQRPKEAKSVFDDAMAQSDIS